MTKRKPVTGLTEGEIADLKENIANDDQARDSAKKLLLEGVFYISSGEPVPVGIGAVICTLLDYFADQDPVGAFPHLYLPKLPQKGRQRRESEAEWHSLIRDIAIKAKRLGVLDSKKNFQTSAFYLIAVDRQPHWTERELDREGKRLRKGWNEQMKRLPDHERKTIMQSIDSGKNKKRKTENGPQ